LPEVKNKKKINKKQENEKIPKKELTKEQKEILENLEADLVYLEKQNAKN
jgi:hypothetical protein